MKKYVCSICGYVYDEAAGIPSAGIAPGTLWENLPDDWVPQSHNTHTLLKSLLENPPTEDFPAETVKNLLHTLPDNN